MLYVILFSVETSAQRTRFRPYVSYGPELRLVGASMVAHPESPYEDGGGGGLTKGYDAIFNVDYGLAEWFGIGGGVGVSSVASNKYYLIAPVKFQFKAGFFWLEPGIENKFFLGRAVDKGRLSDDDMSLYYLAGSIVGRFKLFRGLSLSVGYSKSLTEVAYYQNPDVPVGANTSYSEFALSVGVRYMFNQPYGKRGK